MPTLCIHFQLDLVGRSAVGRIGWLIPVLIDLRTRALPRRRRAGRAAAAEVAGPRRGLLPVRRTDFHLLKQRRGSRGNLSSRDRVRAERASEPAIRDSSVTELIRGPAVTRPLELARRRYSWRERSPWHVVRRSTNSGLIQLADRRVRVLFSSRTRTYHMSPARTQSPAPTRGRTDHLATSFSQWSWNLTCDTDILIWCRRCQDEPPCQMFGSEIISLRSY